MTDLSLKDIFSLTFLIGLFLISIWFIYRKSLGERVKE